MMTISRKLILFIKPTSESNATHFEMIYVILFDWLPSKKQPNKVMIKGIQNPQNSRNQTTTQAAVESCLCLSLKDVPNNFHLMQTYYNLCEYLL